MAHACAALAASRAFAVGLPPDRSLPHRLAAVFKNRAGARVIGGAYLAQHSEEDIDRLVSSLMASSDAMAGAVREGDDRVLKNVIRERIRNDFATRRTVNVDGWVLARTEARLCALNALL